MNIGQLKTSLEQDLEYNLVLPIYRVHLRYFDELKSHAVCLTYLPRSYLYDIDWIGRQRVLKYKTPVRIHLHKPVATGRELLERLEKFDDDLPVLSIFNDIPYNLINCEVLSDTTEHDYMYSEDGLYVTGEIEKSYNNNYLLILDFTRLS